MSLRHYYACSRTFASTHIREYASPLPYIISPPSRRIVEVVESRGNGTQVTTTMPLSPPPMQSPLSKASSYRTAYDQPFPDNLNSDGDDDERDEDDSGYEGGNVDGGRERGQGERQPLLQHQQEQTRTADDGQRDYGSRDGEEEEGVETVVVEFSEKDRDDPRNWSRRRKMVNVGIIALMAGECL